MSQSTEERIAAFTQAVDQARQDVDRMALMTEEIKAIEAAETSPDRSVTVVAGASGSVKSVKITDVAMSKSAQALSQLVHRTFQLAMAKAARQQAEIVQRYAGGNTKIVEKVNKMQEDLLDPQVNDGFQLHGRPETEDSVMSRGNLPAPPRPPMPSYPAPAPQAVPPGRPPMPPPGGPHSGGPQSRGPQSGGPQSGGFAPAPPAAPRPAARPAPDEDDDFESGSMLTDNGARSRPRPTAPPPARDDNVFHFGAGDY